MRMYLASFILLESFLVGTFSAIDLFSFYIFFESILIPMYLIIGFWGGNRRIYSAYKFFSLYSFRISFNASCYYFYIKSLVRQVLQGYLIILCLFIYKFGCGLHSLLLLLLKFQCGHFIHGFQMLMLKLQQRDQLF